MFDLICEKCGSKLIVDNRATLDRYIAKVDYIKDDLGNICDIALGSYLTYQCIQCTAKIDYTFKEVEQKARESITNDVKIYRKKHVFRNFINLMYIDQDSGIEFCGRCLGVDNEGNCYKDIISQCPFRKEDNEL